MNKLSNSARRAGMRAAVAAAGLAALTVALPASAQEVRIGALMPLTGGLAQYGASSVNGVNLAATHVNAMGGILGGQTLRIVTGDTQTNPQAGVAAAQQLVRVQGVVGLIGALASGVTIPVATSVSAVDGVLQISGASTAPGITTLADNDFLFRTTPSDKYQGLVLGGVARENGFSRLAILYVNNDYGIGLAEAFRSSFEAQGGTITAYVPFEEGQASYRGELQAAARGDAEALVHIAYPGDGIPQIRQALEEGFFTRFVFTDGMKSTEMIETIGAQFLNGSIGTAPEALETDASVLFRAAYEVAHGEVPPLPFIAEAYDATFLMALAIQAAGSTDRTAVRDALRGVASAPGVLIMPGEWDKAVTALAAGQDIDYVGAAGSQDFDAAGDVPGTIGVWTILDGEITTLEIRG
jgi:ABC-type branched-subunit amino acid transport system substrate-binding protein